MRTVDVRSYPTPLSAVCLGTAAMGRDGLTGEPVERAFAILDTYYAMGGRFLDTANVYGRWGVDRTNASEQVIGRWLRERRIDDVTVATKACHFAPETPEVSRVDAASLAADVEESRRSLGLDTLDILLLHRDNEAVDIRSIVDFCVPLVTSGKVRRFGFSNFSAERTEEALQYLGGDWYRYFAGVSNEWSLAMDGAESYAAGGGMQKTDDALRAVRDGDGMPLFPFSSIAHGFFEKLSRCGAVYENGTWENTEDFTGNKAWLTDKNGRAYNRLTALAQETGVSLGMLSLAYLLAEPNTIPIMSVSRTDQLRELARVTEMDWSGVRFA